MRLISEEDPSYKELAALIRADAAFAAEVLRLANSAVFGLRYQIVDVMHGVAVLGLTRLTGLVLTVAMRDLLKGARQQEAVRQCWRHNFACALATELLAEACWVDKGLGYTAGLIHDVGLLALVCSNPETYATLLASGVSESEEFVELERQSLGIDHCAAGGWLLADWGMPEEFGEVAERHHDLPREDDLEITDLVRKGCQTARMAGFTVSGEPPGWDLDLLLSWLVEPARERFRGQFEELPMTIATKINTFDCDFL